MSLKDIGMPSPYEYIKELEQENKNLKSQIERYEETLAFFAIYIKREHGVDLCNHRDFRVWLVEQWEKEKKVKEKLGL